eukprot:7153619-Pyramimonas_sp.AAC.1
MPAWRKRRTAGMPTSSWGSGPRPRLRPRGSGRASDSDLEAAGGSELVGTRGEMGPHPIKI